MCSEFVNQILLGLSTYLLLPIAILYEEHASLLYSALNAMFSENMFRLSLILSLQKYVDLIRVKAPRNP